MRMKNGKTNMTIKKTFPPKKTCNLRMIFLLVILFFFSLKFFHREYQCFLVDKYGVEVKAYVYKATRKEKFSRRANYYVYYEFPVKKRWYKKKAGMFHNEFYEGDSIKVKYLPENPDVNFLTDRIDNSIYGLTKKIMSKAIKRTQ